MESMHDEDAGHPDASVTRDTTRGGPAQAMRTLLCVFPKVFTKSRDVLPVRDEQDSGGNRTKKADVEQYLADTLGDAPKAVWGLPSSPGGKDHGAGLCNFIAGAIGLGSLGSLTVRVVGLSTVFVRSAQFISCAHRVRRADVFNWALQEDIGNGTKDPVTGTDVQKCLSWSRGEKWKVDWAAIYALGALAIIPHRPVTNYPTRARSTSVTPKYVQAYTRTSGRHRSI